MLGWINPRFSCGPECLPVRSDLATGPSTLGVMAKLYPLHACAQGRFIFAFDEDWRLSFVGAVARSLALVGSEIDIHDSGCH